MFLFLQCHRCQLRGEMRAGCGVFTPLSSHVLLVFGRILDWTDHVSSTLYPILSIYLSSSISISAIVRVCLHIPAYGGCLTAMMCTRTPRQSTATEKDITRTVSDSTGPGEIHHMCTPNADVCSWEMRSNTSPSIVKQHIHTFTVWFLFLRCVNYVGSPDCQKKTGMIDFPSKPKTNYFLVVKNYQSFFEISGYFRGKLSIRVFYR